MLPFNVEFFDYNGFFVTNANADGITIATDYLSGGENTLEILNVNNADKIDRGGYLHIQRSNEGTDESYFGYIKGITRDKINNSQITIRWCDILDLLDTAWCIDTDAQGTIPLETFIATELAKIMRNLVSVGYATGIKIETSTTSSTTDWGFNLKSDAEGQHHTIVNFKSVIVDRALKEYNIAIRAIPEFAGFQRQSENIVLRFEIGKISENAKTIEADISNISAKVLYADNQGEHINRITIYNGNDYSESYTYMIAIDGDVYRQDIVGDELQQFPVIYDVQSLTTEGTFYQAANAHAKKELKPQPYVDLIEIEVANNDTLIKPLTLEIAQTYNIIFDGKQYTTILTGKKVKNGTTILTFGTNRLDLTKLLKAGGK